MAAVVWATYRVGADRHWDYGDRVSYRFSQRYGRHVATDRGTMVLSVEAEDTQASVRIARELAAALRENPEVAWLRAGVEEDQLRELYGLYFPRRFGFLSEAPERELPDFFSDAALRERARQLKLRLASPAATFFEELAVADPIGAFERVIERARRSETRLASRGGQFVTRDERFAIILLGLQNSAFASGPQARLLRDIDAAFEQARAGSDARLEMSGANRFAVAIEQRMKGDIALIASISFVGGFGKRIDSSNGWQYRFKNS